jgi:hypothetical protein
LKSKGIKNVAQKMRQIVMSPRIILDYMKMTKNSCSASAG